MQVSKFDKFVSRVVDLLASVIAFILSLIFFPVVGAMKFYRNFKNKPAEKSETLIKNKLDLVAESALDYLSSFVAIVLKFIFLPFTIILKASNTRSNKQTLSTSVKN